MKEDTLKKKIKEAFIGLIQRQYPFEKITVKQVITEANVSRATFYIHYENLADMLEEIGDDILEKLYQTACVETTKGKIYYIDVCNYKKFARHIHQNQDLFSLLLSNKGDAFFYIKWQYKLQKLLLNRLRHDKIQVTPELEKMAELISFGAIKMVIETFQERKYLLTLNALYVTEFIIRALATTTPPLLKQPFLLAQPKSEPVFSIWKS